MQRRKKQGKMHSALLFFCQFQVQEEVFHGKE